MSSPAPQSPQSQPAPSVTPARLRAQLDCPTCCEPYSHVVGPQCPRTLVPCGHTFCTECIAKQLSARGPDDFRCLTHDQPIALSKAEDAMASFALMELLERISMDADHQAVDERTKPPSCSECDEAATCYCKNDDACYCDAHRASEHSNKVRSNHVIVPIAERTPAVLKCGTHKSKELDLWCTQCSVLCCTMCERSGPHQAHARKLAPVDDVVNSQRDRIEKMSKEATALMADKWAREAATLIALKADFEASARRVQEEIAKQEAEMLLAVQARYAELREETQRQLANGLKHIAIRVDDLTLHRSRTTVVPEEAARVLRMSEYAMLAHALSVEQNAVRSRKGWDEYQRTSMLPQPMELKSAPVLLLSEIAVAGLVCHPWSEVANGKPVKLLEEDLPLSTHRSSELAALRVEHALAMQSRRASAVQSLKSALQSCVCQYCRVSVVNPPATCSHSRHSGRQHNNAHTWSGFQSLSQLIESMEKEL